MDAHYEQVMAARQTLADGPPRAYFAYSTLLDPAAFQEWRHQHGYDFFQLPPGTPAEGLDLALVYTLVNFTGTIAVCRWARFGNLAVVSPAVADDPASEERP